ncbi:MAG: hypothetical protein M3N08_04490, partial [Pseudomonadota bacterium]|nr:hypothetical protein [Pseudomonadota bacterium]
MTADQNRDEYFIVAQKLWGIRQSLVDSIESKSSILVTHVRPYLGDMLYLVDIAVETGKKQLQHSP